MKTIVTTKEESMFAWIKRLFAGKDHYEGYVPTTHDEHCMCNQCCLDDLRAQEEERLRREDEEQPSVCKYGWVK